MLNPICLRTLGADYQDPEPGSAGQQLQAAPQGRQRGHQDPEPRAGRVRGASCGQRAPGDPAPHPAAL